jgi:hypothetical protein
MICSNYILIEEVGIKKRLERKDTWLLKFMSFLRASAVSWPLC